MNKFYWILNFILIFDTGSTVGRSISSNLQYLTREFNCSWIKNAEIDEDFPGHQYIIAENCLYYYLQDQSNADGKRSNPSMLTVAAPMPSINGSRIAMNVKNLEIMKVHLDDGQTKATIKGNFKLSWQDQRVKWNVDEWKLNSLRIMSSSHIWNPALYPSRSTSSHEFGFASLNSVMAFPNGTVSGRIDLNVHSPCDIDFTEFPYDEHKCCFNLYSPNFQNVIEFHLESNQGELSRELKSAGFLPKDITMTVDSQEQFLHTCIVLARQIGTIKIELSLPMSVASLVWLTSSMLGDLKRQIVVKLFSILLEFLCFQFLVQRTPSLGLGYNRPKVFQFYEFTIAMTLANTLVTVLLYALSKKDRTSAPSNKIYSFFQNLNSRIYCCSGSNDEGDEDGLNTSDKIECKISLIQREWVEIFVGYNIIFSLFATIGYLIGITVLFCW